MKKLLLAILCMPALAYGQTYTYSKLITERYGSDNFSFDRGYCRNISGGNIELKENTLYIDKKQYTLTPKKARNAYKSKNCSFQLLYANGQLAAIRQTRHDEVTLYVIDELTVSSSK